MRRNLTRALTVVALSWLLIGLPRPGSVWAAVPGEILIDTTADDDLADGCVGGQQCSLRSAIRLANTRPGRDVIYIGAFRFGGEHRCSYVGSGSRDYCEVRLTRPLPAITSPVDFLGGGDDRHYLTINASALVSVHGLVLGPGSDGSKVNYVRVSSSPGWGLDVWSSSNRIERVQLYSNRHGGLNLTGGSRNTVSRSTLLGNGGDPSIPGDGVFIYGSNNTIDHTRISGSGRDGIRVGSGTGNRFTENSICCAAGIGINLGADSATPNDPGDGDAGPNDLQNYPVLRANNSAGGTQIDVVLNSTPGRDFVVELFQQPNCGGTASADTFVTSVTVRTNASGFAITNVPVATLPLGTGITATATLAPPASDTTTP